MAMPRIGKHNLKAFVSVACALSLGAQAAQALSYELDNHEFDVGFRSRLARVEAEQNARAASALIRLRASSQWSDQIFTLVELDHVELGYEDDFSNGENFNNAPVIPDVAGTDLNQLLIRYSPINTVSFSLGRETLKFGNQRFIGSNNFWQNEQTFDTTGLEWRFGAASSVSYRYVDNANRINGNNAGRRLNPNDSNYEQNNGLRPAPFLGDHDHDSHFLFAQFKEWDFSRVQAYFYDIDIKDAQPLSNQSVGARYEYRGRIGKLRAQAHGELALQKRPEVNNDADLLYHDVGAGLGFGSSELSLNYERLGEDKGVSFVTPLSSLHDQNGWADQFLITPASGLNDYSLRYVWRDSPWQVDARYHLFNADTDNRQIGREFDLDLSYQFTVKSSLLLRVAEFSATDADYNDERRVFFMFIYNL